MIAALHRLRVGLFAFALVIALTTRLTAAPTADPVATITATLTAQAAAWNRGDIPAFMETYERSADLRFASGGRITRGWQPTLDGYLKRYPDRATMGTLAFTDLEITVLGPDAAVVFGHWKLTREKDTPHGLFTLTVVRREGRWRIIQDHTSSAP